MKCDIGLIGLAVMGQNLVLNMNDKGYSVAVFNRTVSKVDDFIEGPAKGRDTIVGAHSLEDFVEALERPRRVMLLVKAGDPVDKFIDKLLPHLEEGDIIIDGGNSNFEDTIRRTKYVEEKGLKYIGTGVSGGEEGARHGPSIMPGGTPAAWQHVKPIFQDVAAQVDGEPCCDWVGANGAGHFVKMVHNGIEYGDMQLICEAYSLMQAFGLEPAEMSEIFGEWNTGVLDSYLIEITRDILGTTDDETGKPMVDLILDTAGQKGTGKWTAINSLDLGQPVTLIGEAVFARFLSALKDQRVNASKVLQGPGTGLDVDKDAFIEAIHDALYASKIVSYAQGFQLLRAAAEEYDWDLNYGEIAMMWRGGCIIRSQFLGRIKEAFEETPDLENLLLHDYFKNAVEGAQNHWREVIAKAVTAGVPVPASSTALAYYDGYRSERLPANLLQAQRDYFGAHTYERVDKPRGEYFHTDWTGEGGPATAGSYNA
ncbi:MAG: decarboxylating NADP(+)-dependent phosphogluconate dehydrogenase [Candidatus Marinimicrobia bacterium]|nr:decarboxylating NADP(+)-dependent phosphogluconate dehydrogenase [Candidatus Neomarinimicrobiota bacterium]MCF7827386.1 decarboxylating NADP(+)-dependent phosphogluconate dehydrogenase [Candidatus Neomarinimicrobiota bacterium]MCF7881381.1 decarboxylating NADP(+)-dependent phosphogluconate dehydrogenase [Candidatus Neomarinimicrobiota bacterium]